MHAALWEAVRAGLVFRQESAYKFLHDRIQQAAYSLIPEEHRAEVHLRIGRVLLASMTADELAEHLFDVANQLQSGRRTLLVDRDEKAQVATIDLRAGRKAKASAAYASACVYFAAGMALLDERDWGSQYELTFSLWLERAECEFLTGTSTTAEATARRCCRRRARTIVDHAAVTCVRLNALHDLGPERPQPSRWAWTTCGGSASTWPAHPTGRRSRQEYERSGSSSGPADRGLIDSAADDRSGRRATMDVLSVLTSPALFTDLNLISPRRLSDGEPQPGARQQRRIRASPMPGSGASSGRTFGDYQAGFRFGKLGLRPGREARLHRLPSAASTCRSAVHVAPWTQPIATAVDFLRRAFAAASETGDLTYACLQHAPT